MESICRIGANPEKGKDRAASCRPPVRSWPPERRSGRVATARYPPPRPSSIVMLPADLATASQCVLTRPADSPLARLSSVLERRLACDPARRRWSVVADQSYHTRRLSDARLHAWTWRLRPTVVIWWVKESCRHD